jgi:hypothetical protein
MCMIAREEAKAFDCKIRSTRQEAHALSRDC